MVLWIEFGLVLIALILAFGYPQFGADWLARIERPLGWLAQRQGLSVLVVGLAALFARAIILPILPIPEPSVHDEFGYLLMADTFTHGRLTNPTHPMWVHFETFSVLQKPTYQCFAQPAQGLFLAVGKVIFGHPFWGVWLSVGAMCAAICWMLQAWIPPEWALLGGLLAVARLGMFSYWANSYWGGAVSATGGALLLGALPRIIRFGRTGDALLMGLGLTLLANSRPYEGFILSLPVAIALLAWILRKRGLYLWNAVRQVVMPLSLLLILAATAMGYYFWRVTGNPYQMPYELAFNTYFAAPFFIWQSAKPAPTYHHEAFRELYSIELLNLYHRERSISGMTSLAIERVIKLWAFYVGPLMTIPLIMATVILPFGFRWKRFKLETRFLLFASATSIAGLAVEVFFFPHYLAPMTCLIFVLLLTVMHHLRTWKWNDRAVGLFLTRAVPLICLLMVGIRIAAPLLHLSLGLERLATWCNSTSAHTDRTRIQSELEQCPGNHLVIVRYNPGHDFNKDMVFNAANIDAAKIVWARDMGARENEELTRYFTTRHVWLLAADDQPLRLSHYQAQFSHVPSVPTKFHLPHPTDSFTGMK